MMRRSAGMILLLPLGFGLATPLSAAERGPVCREPSVVDEITREVQARNYYGAVQPGLVTEQPTADPSVVRCDVCVLSAPYDMTRFGDRPAGRCVPSDFEVRIVGTGFVVSDLRN